MSKKLMAQKTYLTEIVSHKSEEEKKLFHENVKENSKKQCEAHGTEKFNVGNEGERIFSKFFNLIHTDDKFGIKNTDKNYASINSKYGDLYNEELSSYYDLKTCTHKRVGNYWMCGQINYSIPCVQNNWREGTALGTEDDKFYLSSDYDGSNLYIINSNKLHEVAKSIHKPSKYSYHSDTVYIQDAIPYMTEDVDYSIVYVS